MTKIPRDIEKAVSATDLILQYPEAEYEGLNILIPKFKMMMGNVLHHLRQAIINALTPGIWKEFLYVLTFIPEDELAEGGIDCDYELEMFSFNLATGEIKMIPNVDIFCMKEKIENLDRNELPIVVIPKNHVALVGI